MLFADHFLPLLHFIITLSLSLYQQLLFFFHSCRIWKFSCILYQLLLKMLLWKLCLYIIGRSLATSYGKKPPGSAKVDTVNGGRQRAKNQRNDILFAIIINTLTVWQWHSSVYSKSTVLSIILVNCIITLLRLLISLRYSLCVAVDNRHYIRLTNNTLQFAKSYMIFVQSVLKLYTPEIHKVAMEALGNAFYAHLKHFKRSFQTPAFASQV